MLMPYKAHRHCILPFVKFFKKLNSVCGTHTHMESEDDLWKSALLPSTMGFWVWSPDRSGMLNKHFLPSGTPTWRIFVKDQDLQPSEESENTLYSSIYKQDYNFFIFVKKVLQNIKHHCELFCFKSAFQWDHVLKHSGRHILVGLFVCLVCKDDVHSDLAVRVQEFNQAPRHLIYYSLGVKLELCAWWANTLTEPHPRLFSFSL